MPIHSTLGDYGVEVESDPPITLSSSTAVLRINESVLIFRANDHFIVIKKDIKEQIEKLIEKNPLETLIDKPDFKVFLSTSIPKSKSRRRANIAMAYVVNNDNTLQTIYVTAKGKFINEIEATRKFVRKSLKTLVPGTTKLNTKARTNLLGAMLLNKFSISVPDEYIISLQNGPDFVIFRIAKIETLEDKNANPSLGIYVGGHPNLHNDNEEGVKTEKIKGKLLNQDVEWIKWKENNSIHFETKINPEKIHARLWLHIFYSASTEKELTEVKKIAESFKYVEEKQDPTKEMPCNDTK